MRYVLITSFFTALIFMMSCGGDGAPKTDGKSLYTSNCVQCHGAEGNAGVLGAADLTKTIMDENNMFVTIKEGKGAMVGFQGTLSDEQIYAIIKHVKGLKK